MAPVKIAYLILAHNTPNHMKRLIHALDSANSTFFIHVDRNSNLSLFRNSISQRNVTFLDDRIGVFWGEFSQVQAIIKLIVQGLNQSPPPEYLVLLSGSDYPLRSAQYIEDFFSLNEGREFINLVSMPAEAVDKTVERLQQYRLQTPSRSYFVKGTVRRVNGLINEWLGVKRDYGRVFKDLKPYAGSTWWALTADACRHIVSFMYSKPDVVKFFRNTVYPDESFFQTIIGNSEFGKRVVRNLTFADWSRPGPKPAQIDMEHLRYFFHKNRVIGDDAYGRGELLFARKFADDSSQLTGLIDEALINCSRVVPTPVKYSDQTKLI